MMALTVDLGRGLGRYRAGLVSHTVYLIADVDVCRWPLDAAAMSAHYADLVDFVDRHRPCGTLTGDATEPSARGYMLTVACSCGVTFARWITPYDAMADMVMSALLAMDN